MNKINCGFLFQDEYDNYYQSATPPAYLLDVFSQMTAQTSTWVKTNLPWRFVYSYEQVIDDDTTLEQILIPYVDFLKCDRNRFFMCSSMAHVRIGKEIIHILKYSFPMKELLERFNEENLNVFLVFSTLQGTIWKEGQLRYYMNSHEEGQHHTPHVHVISGDGNTASINILNGEVLTGHLTRKHEKLAKEKVLDYQNYLVDCWNTMTDGLVVDINFGMGVTNIKE